MVDVTAAFCLYRTNGETFRATGVVWRGRLLQEMPRPTGLPVLSMVPYAQIRERGYAVHDGGEEIISLVTTECTRVELAEVVPAADPPFELVDVAYDQTDREFADVVRRVVAEEICRGEGANFLISRKGRAKIRGFSAEVAAVIFGRLVANEPDAYLTFCFFDGERFFIGSSPERHVTIDDDLVTMNPICGTLPTAKLQTRRDLLDFLDDPKEVNELFQVVDEELKMMAKICPNGGLVQGPHLKEMSSVIHTEYTLVGRSTEDKVGIFRDSMFAATMIGSPLESAAKVIRKHEQASRRYYSSALVLHGIGDSGREYLDSAITIRTMEVDLDGNVLLQSGASIVRDSSPESETEEVKAKVAGLLRAISSAIPVEPKLPAFRGDELDRVLASRNDQLSNFWMDRQGPLTSIDADAKRSILVVDNEDEFTYMLGHLLRHLGHDVVRRRFDDESPWPTGHDLVLVGPGPGDPTSSDDPKMQYLRRLIGDLMATKTKFLAVCLGHQLLCAHLGLEVVVIDPPLQGVQREVDLFAVTEKVGFYNTFFALPPADSIANFEWTSDVEGRVVALRSPQFCSFQFHVESILTTNGKEILANALEWLR